MLDSYPPLNTSAVPSYGWWTKRIHIGPYIWPGHDSSSLEEYEESIVAVIAHCPKLEVFIAERSLGSSFQPVMDMLALHGFRFLHTIYLVIPGESASKVTGCLGALPCLVAAQIDIETYVTLTED